MSQAIAGETITIRTEDGAVVEAKIEDASKSDAIQAKVLKSDSETYRVDGIYSFDRALLR